LSVVFRHFRHPHLRDLLRTASVLLLHLLLIGGPILLVSKITFAADLNLPPPPDFLPFSSTLVSDWTVTLGVAGQIQPKFEGAKSFMFSPTPILSIRHAGSPETFQSPSDSPSISLIDFGQFQAGPVAKFIPARDSSANLPGLRKVDAAFELGGFAEYFPADWLRTRLEVRKGIGGHNGLVADLSADIIVPITQRLTISGGPRLSWGDRRALSPYFDISPLQSLLSGLPPYQVKSSAYSTGVGAQVSYLLTTQWEISPFVEYDRLLGSVAKSPLVKQRGSANQFTVGIGLSYTFDVKVK
jgi:outer membrane protein